MEKFEIRREGDRVTVVPAGDLVASAVGELRAAMRDLVRSGAREMVMDLEHAEMMDSTGIGLLLSGYNSVSKAGGQFSVVGVSEDIVELLHSMRVHQHFPVSGRRGTE